MMTTLSVDAIDRIPEAPEFEELKNTVPGAQRIGTVAEYTGCKRIKLR